MSYTGRIPAIEFGPTLGINNVADPTDVKARERQICLDIDIDAKGGEKRRTKGYTLLMSGDYKYSWSNGQIMYAVYDGNLVRIHENFSTVEVVVPNVGTSRMVFEDCADTGIVYYSNSSVIGFLKHGVPYTLKNNVIPDRINTFPGQLLAYHGNRLWIAVDNIIWYTDPDPLFEFYRINPEKNFIMRKSTVTLMKPVEDGMYIADDSTYFLPGKDPDKPQPLKFICDYGAKLGAVTQHPVDIELVGAGRELISGKAILWASDRGIRYGMNGGVSGNITRQRCITPTGSYGTCLHKNEDNGFNQLITVVHN